MDGIILSSNHCQWMGSHETQILAILHGFALDLLSTIAQKLSATKTSGKYVFPFEREYDFCQRNAMCTVTSRRSY